LQVFPVIENKAPHLLTAADMGHRPARKELAQSKENNKEEKRAGRHGVD
jgi:hypothetical protein